MHAHLIHPNIVQFLGVCQSAKSVAIVTKLMHCSLDSLLFLEEGHCSQTNNSKLFIAQELLKGLAYLHSKDIVQADVKPPNILMNESQTLIKLCDMGLSRVKKSVQKTKKSSAIARTPLYIAPECLVHSIKPSKASDVWAAGCTILNSSQCPQGYQEKPSRIIRHSCKHFSLQPIKKAKCC